MEGGNKENREMKEHSGPDPHMHSHTTTFNFTVIRDVQHNIYKSIECFHYKSDTKLHVQPISSGDAINPSSLCRNSKESNTNPTLTWRIA